MTAKDEYDNDVEPKNYATTAAVWLELSDEKFYTIKRIYTLYDFL